MCLRRLPGCGGLQPATHGGADEQRPGDDAGHSDVPHGFHVVLCQSEPVDEGADAQQHHAVAVGPLRLASLV